MDKDDFMNFVNSVRWHCTFPMETTTLNGDLDRSVRGVCYIRPDCTKKQFRNRNFIGLKKDI